jgi:beta-aspartyl-dipeptidase (metallo-type)
MHSNPLKIQIIHDNLAAESKPGGNRMNEEVMATLIKGGEVYSPSSMGKKDILILADRIAAVSEPGQIEIKGIPVLEVNASGKLVIPGFVDTHVHILGGGGEGGPSTRAPEITLEDIISSGVTTVIGCLGTDGTTRHMESLLAKARGLEIEGITTYIFSGSYQIPVVTITGSVRMDIALIDKVIGAGEIALSDHRSSQPTFEEFTRLAAECRVGGMLGNKAGVLHCHLGDGPRKLDYFFRLVKETEIPATQIIPTHANRNAELLDEAIRFILQGGYVDLTAGEEPDSDEQEVSIATALKFCRKNEAPLEHITISSDSNGSMPRFDKKGRLTGLTIATQKTLLANFRHLLENKIVELQEAIKLFSTTPSIFYKLPGKGEIRPGKDADLLLMDKEFHLTDVYSRGRRMMADGELVVKGTFS